MADPATLDASPGRESTPETPSSNTPATSPVPDVQKVHDMDKEARLRRIRYLVDQSQLYTNFLAPRLQQASEDRERSDRSERSTDPVLYRPSDQQSQQPPTKKPRSSKSSKQSKKPQQRTLTSFFTPATQMKSVSSSGAGSDHDSNPDKNRDEHSIAPKALTATLYPYQADGVRWMTTLYENGVNGILADEMGLGKTLQVIAFLAYLMEQGVTGPFLVVGPLSTVGNWCAEFRKFTPSINVCPYYGIPAARAKLRQKYLPPSRGPQVPVVVTSYELVMADARFLHRFEWKYVIVDEGHRLKNINCKLMRELKQYSSANRLLLTGTPLQNNLTELWSLLNFLLPDVFTDLDIFQTWFETGGGAAIEGDAALPLVTSLHSILRPFLLRRLKSEVNLNLPPKREYVIYTGLAPEQTELYRNILSGHARAYVVNKILQERGSTATVDQILGESHTTDGNDKSGSIDVVSKRRREPIQWSDSEDESLAEENVASQSESENEGQRDAAAAEDLTKQMVKAAQRELASKRFSNMMMQLRLACDSPFLFWYPWINSADPIDERIVKCSGKMAVLDMLVARLSRSGHRVLVFSQFTKMLDLLEDWAQLRDYRYCRLDGSTSQSDREEIIDDWSEQSPLQLFLLSTRSGGQGVNLTAADTVILFDSDWNPQQDLQAMDRVHRIGQNKPVLVFRLVAGDTVEQDMLDRANSKLELTTLVIERGHFKGAGSKAQQEEQIHSMDVQLNRHTTRFKGTTHLATSDLRAMLDRSPGAYKRAQKQPQLSENIVCQSVEL